MKKKKILVVDDETSIADLLAALLGAFHPTWEVQTANTAATAACILEEVGDKELDCLITDYNLKDGVGTELIEVARRRHLPAKLILMSGADEETARQTGKTVGIDGFLKKPFAPKDLARVLHLVGLA